VAGSARVGAAVGVRRAFRRQLVAVLWTGAAILVARGVSGLLDDAVRQLGISDRGITGLTYQHTLGTPTPSTYTLVSTDAVDAYFVLGGLLVGRAARLVHGGDGITQRAR
jgi:hypothetical protein